MKDPKEVPRLIYVWVHDRFVRVRLKIAHWREYRPHWLHPGHEYAHLAYFAAVAVEGHGMYATAGGVLFIIGLGLLFFKEGDL